MEEGNIHVRRKHAWSADVHVESSNERDERDECDEHVEIEID